MADMASMAPTSGGQYHWVSEFAPKRAQKFLSYIVGYTAALGWQCGTASAGEMSNPGSRPEPILTRAQVMWQQQ